LTTRVSTPPISGNSLDGTVQAVCGKVQAGQPLTPADYGGLWLAGTNATHKALGVIDSLYTSAGAASV
jgi:hypothetical protein